MNINENLTMRTKSLEKKLAPHGVIDLHCLPTVTSSWNFSFRQFCNSLRLVLL